MQKAVENGLHYHPEAVKAKARRPSWALGLARLPAMHSAVPGEVTTELAVLDAMEPASEPELAARFTDSAHQADLVSAGASLGWVVTPLAGMAELLGHVACAVRAGDAALRAAWLDRRLVGLGYWLRYTRPTAATTPPADISPARPRR